MNYKVEGLNELSKQLHELQVKMGFNDPNIAERLMLVHSEISEAFEAIRKDKYANIQEYNDYILDFDRYPFDKEAFEMFIKNTHEDEIADTIIKLLAYCGENNINIEWHLQNKIKYNELI